MPVECESDAIADARAAIICWYAANARTLPWRTPPGSPMRTDPYHVWLSEIMLQQTTVAAVIPYFNRFTTRWPTLSDLAAANPADVLAAWAGLGYYSRARNLIACAQVVLRDHGGALPTDVGELRALPGIGDYSAAAIASIAFGINAIPVDANIERVTARLFAIDTPLPAAKAAIHDAAAALWPNSNGGDFAQAMMDLGATICTARNPACGICPAFAHCQARAAGIAATLPVKPPKKPKPHRHGRAQWIVRDDHVWLVRRPAKGMLGGMRALPGDEWDDAAPTMEPETVQLGIVHHVFTHFTLDLAVDAVEDTPDPVGEGEWWPLNRLDEAGLPTLYRRAAHVAMGETIS
jgi:A/G-specific adenine glycosylase